MNDILGMPLPDQQGGSRGMRAVAVASDAAPVDPAVTAAAAAAAAAATAAAAAITGSSRITAVRILAVIAVGWVAYLAKAIVLPIVAALILSFLLRPPVRWLKRLGVPNAFGALLVLCGIFALGTLAVVELSGPAAAWIEKLPQSMNVVKKRVAEWRHPVDQVNAMAKQVSDITASATGVAATAHVEPQGEAWSTTLLSNAQETLALASVTAILLFFFLAAGDGMLSRIVQSFPRNHGGGTEVVLGNRPNEDSARLLQETEHQVAGYLWIVTCINLGLGIAVGIALHLLGMPNAVLWGVLCCVLNFVPFIGNIVGIGMVSLVSVVSFDEFGRVVAPPLAFMVLVMFEANVVTPYVLGRRFALSPIVIFIWTLVCAWMWGIAGAFIAVPMLAFVKVLCERIESFAPLARAMEP